MANSTVPTKSTGDQLSASELNNIVTSVNSKQDQLISGTNIKTINGTSLVGSGDVTVQGGGTIDTTPTSGSSNAVSSNGVFTALSAKQATLVSGTNIKTVNGTALLGSGDITIAGNGSSTTLTDNLTTTTTGTALDAHQGSVLKGLIDTNTSNIPTKALTADAQAGTDDAKFMTSLKTAQAIAALTPVVSLQPETIAYAGRISSAGSSIDGLSLFALDAFVVKGKQDGWWSAVKFFAPIMGANLAASKVKFVIEPGGVASMTSSNMVEADYVPSIGYYLTTNSSSKFLGTGLNLAALTGSSNTSFSMSIVDSVSDNLAATSSGFMIGDNPTSGDGNIQISMAGAIYLAGQGVSNSGLGGKRVQTANYSGGNLYGYHNGSTVYSFATSTAVNNLVFSTLNTEITIFKSTRFGTIYYQNGKLTSLLFGTGMTQAQGLSLNQALLTLYRTTGRLQTVGGITEFFGDSITAGQGATSVTTRWSSLVAQALGTIEYNTGYPSSSVTVNNSSANNAFGRYLDNVNLPVNNFVMMYGTNDIGQADSSTNGNSTIINDYESKLETIIQAKKDKFQRVLVVSPPWRGNNSVSNQTKLGAYVAAAALAASNKGVPFLDANAIFLDTGNPDSYFVETSPNGLHPNQSGHTLLASHIIALFQGRIYRDAPLDFPSISANSTQDLTLTMYGARTGMRADVGLPATPTAGVSFQAFVSANDTVTVRAINNTGSAIDPASQTLRVTVILDK